MTFFEAFNEIKKEVKTIDLIIYQLIFALSKKVKDKLSYMTNRNEEIDFDFNELKDKCKSYKFKFKPLGVILKMTKFMGMTLEISDGVLVPRNETELLCEELKKRIQKQFSNKNIDIADLCCGSGNVGLYLKSQFKEANVTCVDINEICCRCTHVNSFNNKLPVNILTGDYYKTLIDKNLRFDVIAMNPPYVDEKELDQRMTKYESKISFTNSKNPIEFYLTIINNYEKIVKDKNNFLLGFEIGYNQKEELERHLKKTQLKYEFIKDYSHLDRMLFVYPNN